MQLQQIYKQLDAGRGLLYAWFPSMHSRMDIAVCGSSEIELSAVVKTIYNEVDKLEKIANYYHVDSELCKLNETAFRNPVVVSKDLLRMITLCKEYNKRTFGCFDVTVCSEGHDERMNAAIRISADDSSIAFERKELCIDLSGFLKGYALEKIKDILRAHGVENALVNMGNSSVMAMGNHPYGEGWRVDFGESCVSNAQIPVLYDECLTTSGNNSVGRKHIINPFTHDCIDGMRCVSVITRKGTEGEALSTALFVADTSLQRSIAKDFDIKFYSF